MVSSGTTAITMVDLSGFYVDVSLSESDAGSVKAGQTVSLTLDALSDVELKGTVQSVSTIATTQQNVVTYLVRIVFDPGQAPVRLGMTMTGNILVEEHPNVLNVPSRAVQTRGNAKVVLVQAAHSEQPRPLRVTTGVTIDGRTEITGCVDTTAACLQEGDLVIVQSATSTTRQNTGSVNIRTGGGGGGFPPPGAP